jgi:hypothetical protein
MTLIEAMHSLRILPRTSVGAYYPARALRCLNLDDDLT